jgi:hypothetical protein
MTKHDDDLADPLDVLRRLEDLEHHAAQTGQLVNLLRVVHGPNLEGLMKDARTEDEVRP